jgi:hypothetical protein
MFLSCEPLLDLKVGMNVGDVVGVFLYISYGACKVTFASYLCFLQEESSGAVARIQEKC